MSRHGVHLLPVVFMLALVAGACGATPSAADTPDQAVREAFRLVDAGDLDGLLAATCAAEQESTRRQFGFEQVGSVAGLDLAPLFEALVIDQSGLVLTTRSIQGDRAEVHLGGKLAFSFDAERLRGLFRELAGKQGVAVDESRLDSLIVALQNTTQGLPLNQTIEVVREGGSWKLCSRLTLLP